MRSISSCIFKPSRVENETSAEQSKWQYNNIQYTICVSIKNNSKYRTAVQQTQQYNGSLCFRKSFDTMFIHQWVRRDLNMDYKTHVFPGQMHIAWEIMKYYDYYTPTQRTLICFKPFIMDLFRIRIISISS